MYKNKGKDPNKKNGSKNLDEIGNIINEEFDKFNKKNSGSQESRAWGNSESVGRLQHVQHQGQMSQYNYWPSTSDHLTYDEENQLRIALQMSRRDEEERKERKLREEAEANRRRDEESKRRREEESKKKEVERKRQMTKVNMKRKKVQEKFMNIMDSGYTEVIYRVIMTILDIFETDTKTAIFDTPRTRSYKEGDYNEFSLVIIEMIKIFDGSLYVNNKKIIDYFDEHIKCVQNDCTQIKDVFVFDPHMHMREEVSEFTHQALEGQLVCVDVRGDGNCLWNSISVSLFGDYSHMESLRLITASTLIQFRREFERYIKDQESKYSYKHELTFDQLIDAALDLNVWGDEMHVLALSLALRRPIYSYGSLLMLISDDNMSYEELRSAYESESFHNHFRYTANIEDEKKEPILLYYNGENHYSVVLPMRAGVRALRPQSVILEPLFDRKNVVQDVNDNTSDKNEVFFECNANECKTSDPKVNMIDLGLNGLELSDTNVASSGIMNKASEKKYEMLLDVMRKHHAHREEELTQQIKRLTAYIKEKRFIHESKDRDELTHTVTQLRHDNEKLLGHNKIVERELHDIKRVLKETEYQLKETKEILKTRAINSEMTANGSPGAKAPTLFEYDRGHDNKQGQNEFVNVCNDSLKNLSQTSDRHVVYKTDYSNSELFSEDSMDCETSGPSNGY